jgi:hypothetical protein
MFLSKAQAIEAATVNQNRELLEFAKKKIELSIQAAAEAGDREINRRNVVVAFQMSDSQVVLLQAIQSYKDAGYSFGPEGVSVDGNTRTWTITW